VPDAVTVNVVVVLRAMVLFAGCVSEVVVFIVTAVAAEAVEQPLAFVTVTLKLPALVTLIACVVAPFDQR